MNKCRWYMQCTKLQWLIRPAKQQLALAQSAGKSQSVEEQRQKTNRSLIRIED